MLYLKFHTKDITTLTNTSALTRFPIKVSQHSSADHTGINKTLLRSFLNCLILTMMSLKSLKVSRTTHLMT